MVHAQSTVTARRAEPVQERARATVRHLLSEAEKLLVEVGIDGFNTNLLAERAGVKVRTVYRYYPNKHAIIAALYAALAEASESNWFPTGGEFEQPNSDWRAEYATMVRRWLNAISKNLALMAVIRAVLASPELHVLDIQFMDSVADRMADAFKKRGAAAPRSRLKAIAKVILYSVTGLTDLYTRDQSQFDRRLLREAIGMHQGYLSELFD